MPSTKADVGTHAKSLANVIKHLDGVENVSFVAHSMGNLVIRHCLADLASLPASEQPEITYGRFVMIAPPNHGAEIADEVFGQQTGATYSPASRCNNWPPAKAGRRWSSDSRRPVSNSASLPVARVTAKVISPPFRAMTTVYSQWRPRKLAGASDFVLVKGIHQLLPMNDQVKDYTLRFLEKGYFLPSGTKHPIPATEVARSVP